MSLPRALLQITRPSSTLLTFFSVFVPVYVRTSDLGISLRRSLPLLFVSICTFIGNDLDDIDKDRINHPERPLPSGQIAPAIAASAYFISLVLGLLSVRFYVGTNKIAFLYYALLATWISYHYVVEYLPAIKASYVASVSVLPVLIIAAYYPTELTPRYVAVALFLFMLGRELCKDLPDRAGDPKSVLHSVRPLSVARFAFTIQAIGLVLLGLRVRDLLTGIIFVTMFTCVAGAYLCWFRWARVVTALRIMQGVLFLGLCFLL
jgi:geranylgeranylglycerol-phosphate geranylgeranyltransferase